MRAIYPGSFDPVTNGHFDIIERCSRKFDSVVVYVCINRAKKPIFEISERLGFIQLECNMRGLMNVDVYSHEGLISEVVNAGDVLVKGLRAVSDYEYELSMALLNRELNSLAETLFMPTSAEYSFLSSSVVRELAALGSDKIDDLVPSYVAHALRDKFWRSYSQGVNL